MEERTQSVLHTEFKLELFCQLGWEYLSVQERYRKVGGEVGDPLQL